MLRGYVKIRVKGYSPERFLNLCSNRGILIWDLQNHGDSYEMYMSVKGFRQLLPIVSKTQTKVRIIKRCGLPFFMHRYRKRKMFFFGMLGAAALIYAFSLFIWDIRFEGNSACTDEVLMDYLESQKLHHGILKHSIDCEEVEAMLRNQFDDIIWASVEIRGTRLVVHVQESLKMEKEGETTQEEPSDLCAEYAGTVERIITRSGNPLVTVGSQVQPGDILVQGRMEILNDNGEVASYQYCHADADIFIRREYPYNETFSMNYSEKKYEEQEKKSYYARTFSQKWDLAWPWTKDTKQHESFVDEKQLHLWNNFYLPFYWGTVTKKYYTMEEKTYTDAQAKKLAEKNLLLFCEDLQKKGIQIIENNVTIQIENKTCTASGNLIVVERSEKRQPTEILEIVQQEETDEYNGAGT